MTGIVNFEEMMEQEKKNKNFPLTEEFFDSCNRIYDAKLSGSLKENELSDLLILENKFFANLVSKGLKTEEEVEIYENDSDYSKTPIGIHPHKGLDVASSATKQTDAVALFDAETLNKRTQIQDSFSKGLKKAG